VGDMRGSRAPMARQGPRPASCPMGLVSQAIGDSHQGGNKHQRNETAQYRASSLPTPGASRALCLRHRFLQERNPQVANTPPGTVMALRKKHSSGEFVTHLNDSRRFAHQSINGLFACRSQSLTKRRNSYCNPADWYYSRVGSPDHSRDAGLAGNSPLEKGAAPKARGWSG
jgi:hypothetical protein